MAPAGDVNERVPAGGLAPVRDGAGRRHDPDGVSRGRLPHTTIPAWQATTASPSTTVIAALPPPRTVDRDELPIHRSSLLVAGYVILGRAHDGKLRPGARDHPRDLR